MSKPPSPFKPKLSTGKKQQNKLSGLRHFVHCVFFLSYNQLQLLFINKKEQNLKFVQWKINAIRGKRGAFTI